MKINLKRIVVFVIFSVAMAALEAAVVVYLRALYYPGEFSVAMKVIDPLVLLIELTREVGTIVMLLSIAWLTGNSFRERLAFFLLGFAMWDLAYYGWLKIFIDWPATMFDWDILFLIPFVWLAPVAAPVICSLSMIALAWVLLRNPASRINMLSRLLLLSGASLILFTFLEDYGTLIISNGFLSDFFNLLNNKAFLDTAGGYLPTSYSWHLFAAGQLLVFGGIFSLQKDWAWPGKRKITDDLVNIFGE